MPRTAVAIVEENVDVCENLRHFLGLDPDFFCVCTCRRPENALARLGAAAPDIVITDIEFPGWSGGLSCVTGLRRLLPALKILVFTAHHDSGRILAALDAGASGYILKDTPREGVLAALRELRAGGAPLSGMVGRRLLDHIRRKPLAPPADAEPLTPREREVMHELSTGRSAKEIAARLLISTETVNVHLKHSYGKLRVGSRVEAVLKFLNVG